MRKLKLKRFVELTIARSEFEFRVPGLSYSGIKYVGVSKFAVN